MSNNAPDYENNLVFPPTITWTELVEWAKGVKGAKVYDGYFVIDDLQFMNTGEIWIYWEDYKLAENRTPAQMQTIIKALFEE